MAGKLKFSAGVGAALVAFGATWGIVVSPSTEKLPLDASWQTAADGTGTVLDMGSLDGADKLRVDEDVPLREVQQVLSVEPGDGDTLTAQVGSTLSRAGAAGGGESGGQKHDAGEKRGGGEDDTADLVRASVQRITMSRETAEGTEDAANSALQTQPETPSIPVRVEGLSVTFPKNAQKSDYQYYDPTARRAAPMVFSGEDEIDGTGVYSYRQSIDDLDMGEVDPSTGHVSVARSALPESAPKRIRDGEGDVRLERFYSVDRTVDVEPDSGRVVRITTDVHEYFGERVGEEAVPVLDAKTATTDASAAAVLEQARSENESSRWKADIVPWAAGILGAVVLVASLGVGFLSDRRK
ncbi:DUF3068 domain-containing protein [Dietzia sp.]|uniref:DUF3068 domain-containing protein n=1 Tax=Dietzia sp. TaxID=1871616 RepID=UPI002FD92D9D